MNPPKKEEEEGSVLKEPTDQRREEEEEEESPEEPAGRRSEELPDQRKEAEEEGSLLKEPTDQRMEEEDSVLKEATDQQREEESSEEPAGRFSDEPTDQRKETEAERSSDEESEAASTLFVHPCSLLRYLVRAFACCLGMPDSFGGATEKRTAAAPASVDSSREGDEADRSTDATTVSGFYMQEVITRAFAVRRPRPPSGNPREGSGGNGGHHH